MCNGKNASQRKEKETGLTSPRCPSGYLRAVDAEAAVWEQVRCFLTDPDTVLCELGERLAERGGDAGAVEKELARIEAEVGERDVQRALLFRLFRKGSISEGDLERQLAETVEEEKALNLEAERLRGAVKLAGGAKASLDAVRAFLAKLGATLEGQSESEPSWETKRRAIEALVEGVVVRSQVDPSDTRGRRRIHTLCIRYNFEDPRPTKTESGLVLDKELLVGGTYLSLQRDTNAALVRLTNEEKPGMTLDELGEALLEKHGLKLSRASLSRLRAKVGQAPDNIQSRGAKSRKNTG
jgi:transposase